MLGMPGLVRTLALNKRQEPLYIYVPEGEEKQATVLLTFDRAIINYPVIVKGIRPGVVQRGKGFHVSAFRLKHNIPTVGYAFKEEDRIRFLTEKCKKLGIKGEMFKQITKNGSIRIQGKTISLKQVTYVVPGKCVVYAADTRPTASTVKAAKEADLLIHEASYAEEHKDLAKERFHSTAAEVARIAKKANCKSLVLFHMSARYKEAKPLEVEVKKAFKKSAVAYDGMTVSV
jgi:ribonuclease Z